MALVLAPRIVRKSPRCDPLPSSPTSPLLNLVPKLLLQDSKNDGTTMAEEKKTGAESGLNMERQLQVALQSMVDHGGAAALTQIYEAVGRHLPLNVALSEQGKHSLRSYISRDAVQKGYVTRDGHSGWRITVQGRLHLEETSAEMGTEGEETLPGEDSYEESGLDGVAPPADSPVPRLTVKPFDPSAIRVDQRMMTTFQVLRKVDAHEIDLQPDFQRNFVWNITRQSRLIESILLRIPLPAFYLDATVDDIWLVVDGLQRLTTLDHFFTKKDLCLTNLEFLTDFEGMRFSDLPRSIQRQFEDTALNLYIIRPETPANVKFTVFSRVNTGGLVLTPQEIRHALFQGRATTFLGELADSDTFKKATDESINSLRMDDRECILRFLAFHLTSYARYGRIETANKSGRFIQQNLDGFLGETMERINALEEARIAELRASFQDAMTKAHAVFGRHAFRKLYQLGGRRSQISKPLFEVWSVMLLPYDIEALVRSKDAIVEKFIALMNTVEFNKSISLGTGSVRAVHARFRAIELLLKDTVR
jgi:hypothetical protein